MAHSDFGKHSSRANPLEHAWFSRSKRTQPDDDQPIWHAFGLQPHRSDTFKLSPDPQLTEKVRDIVGLYMNPPEHAVVFCVDEKSQIQALDRTQPLLPLRPRVVRQTATLPRPLHTHLWFMDQFGGALARRTH